MRVIAISVDSGEDNRQFAEQEDLHFPLLSDPGGRVAERYGVVRDGLARRASFVLDEHGIIRHIDDQIRVSRHGSDLAERIRELRAASRPTAD